MAQILVVDDSKVVRKDVSEFLISHNFDVITACDGQEGLDTIKNNPDLKLVILDISMPVMNGMTMLEKVRNELNNHKINAIVFTNENDSALKKQFRLLKVKVLIVKPFNGPSVLPVIQRLVQ